MIGQVIKLHSNNYVVLAENKEFACSAKGVLKLIETGILVGDYVEFNGGVIEKIMERSSFFIRPSVANVELILAVISPEPKPDFLMLDKLLASAVKENVEVIFAVNKRDLGGNLYSEITNEYKGLDIKIIDISAKNGDNLEQLKALIKGKLTCLAGQSAVGKSSIVNSLFGLNLRTGELSEKIIRGKHTTTFSEIYSCGEIRLIDTPGFASLSAEMECGELAENYPDYQKYLGKCRFRGCAHINEPNCKIKELVFSGDLSKSRYERYAIIYNELKGRKKLYE